MTVSNIRQIFESSEVESGGTAAATVGSTDALAVVSPVEVEGRGATLESSTLGRLEIALN